MAGKPEALYVPGYYTEVGLIGRQARELGYTGLLLGGDGWDSPKLLEIAGAALEGCFLSNHYSVEDPSPVVQNFVSSYRLRYGEAPDAFAALGYDTMRLLVDCLQRLHAADAAAFAALAGGGGDAAAGAAARARLRDLIAGTRDFPGVTGSIGLDAARNAIKPAVVLEVKSGGFHYRERIGG
jgi:branched-chain amino acid transport system substrate-binding protein